MSGSASLDLERQMLQHTLAIAPMPTLARVYVALCQTAPTEAAGGAELAGGGYARTAATFSLLSTPANAATNATAVDFAPATADWRPITHFELWTAATGGTRLYWGRLVDPADGMPVEIDVLTGSAVRFSPGSLVVQAAETTGVGIGPFLPTAGGEMTGPLVFTTTGTTAARSAQDRVAVVANVLDYGAASGADSTVAFQAAIATGRNVYAPKGNYIIRDQLTLGNGQTLYGDGRSLTTLSIDQTFSVSALAVISLTGREGLSPTVRDLTISFAQPPDQASRANFKTLATGGTSVAGGTGVKYPPAIAITSSNRFKLSNLQIAGAWDGVHNVSPNTIGGFYIRDIEMGALNVGLSLDGCFDFGHILGWHHWNFGLGYTTLYNGVFRDGQMFAAKFGATATCQATFIEDFCTFQGRISVDNSNTWLHFANLGLDGNLATLELLNSAWVMISNVYTSAGVNPLAQIQQIGGTTFISQMFGGAWISVSGGTLSLVNARPSPQATNQSLIVQTGGQLLVRGSQLIVPTGLGAWTVPVVNCTGGIIVFQDNWFNASASGSMAGLSITTDSAQHVVTGNVWNGWNWTPPGGLGFYGPNSDHLIGNHVIVGTPTAGGAALDLKAAAGNQRGLIVYSGNVLRWGLVTAAAEGGSNTGTDLRLLRYDDAGTLVDQPLAVTRSSGITSILNLAIGTNAGPTIRQGNGAATGTQPKGSLWLRADGAVGSTIYVSQGAGSWLPVAGV